jgi:hypothetical protein
MALPQSIRDAFEKEHGYSLDDAYEIVDQKTRESQQEYNPSRVLKSSINMDNIDEENQRLIEELAKRIVIPER